MFQQTTGIATNRGQVLIEYVLLLVVAASLAVILLSKLASRNSENPGLVVKQWRAIQTEIGGEVIDHCDSAAGVSCNQ